MKTIGEEVIDHIISHGLFHASAKDKTIGITVAWSGTASEQLDALIDSRLKHVASVLQDTHEILVKAMTRDSATDLYVAVHMSRDNIRTALNKIAPTQ
jgi:hypothetical protein